MSALALSAPTSNPASSAVVAVDSSVERRTIDQLNQTLTQMTRQPDHEVLRISKDAPPEAIEKAYRKLAFSYHPDRYAQSPDQARQLATQCFQRLGQAKSAMLTLEPVKSAGWSPDAEDLRGVWSAVEACIDFNGKPGRIIGTGITGAVLPVVLGMQIGGALSGTSMRMAAYAATICGNPRRVLSASLPSERDLNPLWAKAIGGAEMLGKSGGLLAGAFLAPTSAALGAILGRSNPEVAQEVRQKVYKLISHSLFAARRADHH